MELETAISLFEKYVIGICYTQCCGSAGPVPMIMDTAPDPGRILTKIQSFKILSFYKEKFCGFPLTIKKRLKYSDP